MKKLTKTHKIIISVAVLGVIGTAIWLGASIIKNKGKTPEQIAEEKRLKELAKVEKKRLKELSKKPNKTAEEIAEENRLKANANKPKVNTTTTTTTPVVTPVSTPVSTPVVSASSNPFGSLPNGASSCERTVQNHDSAWDYAKCSGTWFTKRKGSSSWTSLAGNTKAVNKLEAYSGS